MLEQFTKDLSVIQKLGTFPNQDNGLTDDELKQKFDESALAIQEYINNVLIPEINTLDSGNIENSIILEELNRFVADLQVTVNSVSASNKVTVEQVTALTELVNTFDARIKNCVKTINGIAPDESGNVNVSGGSAEPIKYLQLERRKLQGYDLLALYNGTEFKQAEIPLGFSCIEPNAFNGQSNILQDHLPDMPAMLRGTFKATAASEEEYNFTYAYAFSGGYAEGAFTHCVVIDPGTGKIWHFDFASGSVKTAAIGENGGGSTGGDTYRLAKSITLEKDVSSIVITTDDDGNPLNFSEGYMECLNPKTDANCQAYIWITGEYGNLQNKSFGYVSATAIDVKTFWWFNRLGEKLLLRTSTSNSSINALNDYTYPNLLDIGNITGIEIKTDGANRFLIKTGATLKLYVKE